MHPAVAKDFSVWIEQQNSPFVIKEVAILFETGGYKNVDKTVLITAPETIRIERVMLRDGVTADEVKARMRNQWTDAQRELLADLSLIIAIGRKQLRKLRNYTTPLVHTARH